MKIEADQCIIDYAKNHSKKDCLLYNNRMYPIHKPTDKDVKQYNVNRQYILNLFNK